MIRAAPEPRASRRSAFAASFAEWRAANLARAVPPIVAVGGSRGKTTVVRLLDAIFGAAGLRTALWTDQGVEVNGRRQRGELGPWSRAVDRLRHGSLDVAVQELDWATVHAVGLPPGVYPLVVITNLCGNSETCLAQPETVRAAGALARLRAAVDPQGTLVLGGEDFAVAGNGDASVRRIVVGGRRDAPLIRGHLAAGGTAGWVDDGALVLGTADNARPVAAVDGLPISAGGTVGFQLQNALAAAAAAAAAGIPLPRTTSALRAFDPDPKSMPGTFNVVRLGDATFVVDRPAPSWFLRSTLRAVGHLGGRRQVTVAGYLEGVPDDDLAETGRLLGRNGGALILHGMEASSRAAALRQGIAANSVPPVIVRVGSERQAVSKALAMAGEGDVVLVLADQPAAVHRALERARARISS